MTTYSPAASLSDTLDALSAERVPLERVFLARELMRHAAEAAAAEVAAAREAGATWAEVGDVFGTSRQAAHDRWG